MTRKKDSVKLNRLHLVKRRRMQKYHARKIIRAFAHYAAEDDIWMKILRLFLNNGLHGRVRLEIVTKK
jgi:hypothetical protein